MNFNERQKKVIYAEEPKILCLATAACGKALPNSETIPTPNGPKTVGEIKTGDYLFDRYGNPTKVLGVYPQGRKEVYEFTFGDGRKARSSIDHIWYVHKKTWRNKEEYREYTTKQIIEERILNSDRSANFYIPVAKAVKYPERKYDIHPYVIGAMLGDGCCAGNNYLTISSKDNIVPNRILSLLNGSELYDNKANYNWTFKDENGHLIKTDILPPSVRERAEYKYIPCEYKYGSIEQRLELIRGLMDTDGSIQIDQRDNHKAGGTITFTSISLMLILDVQEVLQSLGYSSTISEDKRDKYTTGVAYRLIINIPNSEKYKIFWLPEKKEKALSIKDIPQNKNFSRTSIRSIEDLGIEEEMTCFYVDNEEHLFLTSNYVVTHNTRVLTERIRVLIEDKGIDAKDVVAISFTNMAADEMKRRIGQAAQGAFIGTIHSYGNKICTINGIDTQRFLDNYDFDAILLRAVKIPSYKYPKIKHLLIDECQDLSPLEYQFLMKIPTENIFFVGDNRQAIYGFRGCTDEYLNNMWKDVEFKKYYLTENYRNAPNIVKFAESFLDSYTKLSPSSMPVKTKVGILEGKEERIPFMDALEELELSQNWGSWFILTRTNNELAAAQEILDSRKIPNVTFKKGDLDLDELATLMTSNRVKVLTIHSAKGLENKNVIVTGARLYNEEERKISYVAATRAENALYWCNAIAKRTKSGQRNLPRSTEAGRIFDKSTTETFGDC